MKQIKHGPTTWAGLILMGAVVEAVALRTERQDHTLSHATRALFRTHTPVGAAVFTVTLIGLVAWFHPHIVNGNNIERSSS